MTGAVDWNRLPPIARDLCQRAARVIRFSRRATPARTTTTGILSPFQRKRPLEKNFYRFINHTLNDWIDYCVNYPRPLLRTQDLIQFVVGRIISPNNSPQAEQLTDGREQRTSQQAGEAGRQTDSNKLWEWRAATNSPTTLLNILRSVTFIAQLTISLIGLTKSCLTPHTYLSTT